MGKHPSTTRGPFAQNELNELFLEACQHYLVLKLWVILDIVAFLKVIA